MEERLGLLESISLWYGNFSRVFTTVMLLLLVLIVMAKCQLSITPSSVQFGKVTIRTDEVGNTWTVYK